jgi:hypothetical protein
MSRDVASSRSPSQRGFARRSRARRPSQGFTLKRALMLVLALVLLIASAASAVVLFASAAGHPPIVRFGAMIVPLSFASAFAFFIGAVVAGVLSFGR